MSRTRDAAGASRFPTPATACDGPEGVPEPPAALDSALAHRPPPADLLAGGRSLWASVVAEFELRNDEVPVLEELCRTVDDLATVRAVLAETGVHVEGSQGQMRPNPLLAEVRGLRLVLIRLTSQLGLPDEEDPGAASRTPAQRRASKAARSRWGKASDGAA